MMIRIFAQDDYSAGKKQTLYSFVDGGVTEFTSIPGLARQLMEMPDVSEVENYNDPCSIAIFCQGSDAGGSISRVCRPFNQSELEKLARELSKISVPVPKQE